MRKIDLHYFLMMVVEDGEPGLRKDAIAAVTAAFGNAGGSGIEKIDSVFIYFCGRDVGVTAEEDIAPLQFR